MAYIRICVYIHTLHFIINMGHIRVTHWVNRLIRKNGRIIQNQLPANCFMMKTQVLKRSLKEEFKIFESISGLKSFFFS